MYVTPPTSVSFYIVSKWYLVYLYSAESWTEGLSPAIEHIFRSVFIISLTQLYEIDIWI